ncbi:PREDICTED: synapsin-1-like [Cercocebus atys]|uniref:synapsin-1-like n=1 Tax=Cercocebus atys TaxID=9531 RepID=UPI0005F4A467|nr:PREDICTED: synapsin-1-like [Cercocebus atys]
MDPPSGPGHGPRRRGRHLARVRAPAAGGAVSRPEAAVRRPRCHLRSVSSTRPASRVSGAQRPQLGAGDSLVERLGRLGGERVPRCGVIAPGGQPVGPPREPPGAAGGRGTCGDLRGTCGDLLGAQRPRYSLHRGRLVGSGVPAFPGRLSQVLGAGESDSDSCFTWNSNVPCCHCALLNTVLLKRPISRAVTDILMNKHRMSMAFLC